ncbi:MAG: hypothetical protein K0S19_1071, partial [Geminicoccaceae bacterium]|nr:hypothetical protein [Geminicoccaceae bacterium]
MTYRWWVVAAVTLSACGGGQANTNPAAGAAPAAGPIQSAPPQLVDSLWHTAEWMVRHGKWGEAQKLLDRVLLEL